MSRFKYYSTEKLKEIANDPYTRDRNGKDLEQYREEILEVLYLREQKILDKYLKEQDKYFDELELSKEFELNDHSIIQWLEGTWDFINKYFSKFLT